MYLSGVRTDGSLDEVIEYMKDKRYTHIIGAHKVSIYVSINLYQSSYVSIYINLPIYQFISIFLSTILSENLSIYIYLPIYYLSIYQFISIFNIKLLKDFTNELFVREDIARDAGL